MRHSPTAKQRGFTHHDQRRLRRRRDSAVEARVFQRVQAVLLVADGQTVESVSAITGLSRPSVYRWLKQYLANPTGCDFQDPPRSGRPQKALSMSDRQLLELMQRSPREFGYLSTGWTVALLTEHLRTACGSDLSGPSVRRRLKQAGLRWKRPRYVFSEPDPHQAQKKGGSCAV